MSLERLFKTTDRTRLKSDALGHSLKLATGNGLFSADRIDDGTRLLLEHLPESAPARVLDVGCGYGALGLPIAARYPNASVELVDRDLVAVAYAARNARDNGLSNVVARSSLGYRDVDDTRFDWILCNVPARIGSRGVEYLMTEGARRLTERGSMCVVVIHALEGQVEEAAQRSQLAVTLVAKGKNHMVYEATHHASSAVADHVAVYERDSVRVGNVETLRPHDISEDPEHAASGLPLLSDVLPRNLAGKRCLLVRGGYGALLRVLQERGARVACMDYDLMNLAFTVLNCRSDAKVETTAAAWPWPADAARGAFDVVVAEVWTRANDLTLSYEVQDARSACTDGGEIYWLGPSARCESVFSAVKSPPRRLGSRGRYSVFRDAR